MGSDWGRVGTLVAVERARRGHRSLSAFAAATGLSRTTVDAIEHGRKTSYSPTTIATVEHALGWAHGSITRILQGLEPRPVEDPDLAALMDAWPWLSAGSRRMLRILAVEAMRANEG
jgi:hypothetical protein